MSSFKCKKCKKDIFYDLPLGDSGVVSIGGVCVECYDNKPTAFENCCKDLTNFSVHACSVSFSSQEIEILVKMFNDVIIPMEVYNKLQP